MHAPIDEQAPALCGSCGGRAAVRDGALHCAYCGASEPLPADVAERVADLERRIAIAASAAAQASGSLHVLASIFERPRLAARGTGALFAFAGGLLAVVVIGSVPTWRATPPELRLEVIAGGLSGPVAVLAIPVSALVALLAGRWRYRLAVRPYLLARAPRVEGAPARCRACGGDLAIARAPLASCRYCGTRSIVGRELHANRAALLERERLDYLARAQGIASRTRRIPSFVELTMGITLLGGLLATWALLLWVDVSSH